MPSFTRRLLTLYIFTILAAPVTYALRWVFAHAMTVEEYGLFYAVVGFLGLIGILNDAGMNQALTHFIPKYLKDKEYKKIKTGIVLVFFVEAVTAVIIFTFMLLAKNILATQYFGTSLALKIIPIFALFFLFENLFELIASIFRGYQKEVLYASTNPLRLLIVLMGSLIVWGLFKTDMLVAFSVIWVASFAIALAAYSIPFAKLCWPVLAVKKFWDAHTAKELFMYGKYAMFSSLATVLLSRIDVVMLTVMRGVVAVGLYEIALPAASIILFATNPLSSFLFPTVSGLHHAQKKSEIRRIIETIYSTGLFLYLPLCLLFFLFAKETIIVLFGSEYLAAENALKILAIGAIFKGFCGLNFSISDAMGQVKKRGKLLIVGAALNILLNVALIPQFGVSGAAMATSMSFAVMCMMSLLNITKISECRIDIKKGLKIIVASAIFIVMIYVLKALLNLNQYIEAAIIITVSGVVYLAIGLWWKIVSIRWSTVRSLLKK